MYVEHNVIQQGDEEIVYIVVCGFKSGMLFKEQISFAKGETEVLLMLFS